MSEPTRKSYKQKIIDGKLQRIHRHVMKVHLGRDLSASELVHHADGDIHNNDPANLVLTDRSSHKKLHPEVGRKSQFKQVHSIDTGKLLELYPLMTMQQMAEYFGCSFGTIQRVAKANGLRSKITCTVCGEFARYRKARLCSKHYLKEYYAAHKIH